MGWSFDISGLNTRSFLNFKTYSNCEERRIWCLCWAKGGMWELSSLILGGHCKKEANLYSHEYFATCPKFWPQISTTALTTSQLVLSSLKMAIENEIMVSDFPPFSLYLCCSLTKTTATATKCKGCLWIVENRLRMYCYIT